MPVHTITGHMLWVQFSWVSQEPWALKARFYNNENNESTHWVFALELLTAAMAVPGQKCGLGDVKFELDVDLTMWLVDEDRGQDIPYVIEFEHVHDRLWPFTEQVLDWGEKNPSTIALDIARAVDVTIQNLFIN